MDSDSELELMQALLCLFELPTVVLREHCPGLRPEHVRRALSGEATAVPICPIAGAGRARCCSRSPQGVFRGHV